MLISSAIGATVPAEMGGYRALLLRAVHPLVMAGFGKKAEPTMTSRHHCADKGSGPGW